MAECKHCKKTISKKSEQCKSCSNKNRPKRICSEITIKKISLSLKGKEPWNKGLTKETNEIVKKYSESMSKSKSGKPNNQKGKHYINKSLRQLGENNHNWKGGITPYNIKLRKRLTYKLWRLSVYERDKYTCQKCLDNTGGNLEAHHIYNFFNNEELRFNITNGITFCEKCHTIFHKKYGYYNNNENQIKEFIEDKTCESQSLGQEKDLLMNK